MRIPNLMKSALMTSTLLVASTLLVGPAAAQQSDAGLQSYDVELVIFRTLSSSATPEDWALEAAAAGQRLAIPEDDASPFAATTTTAPVATTSFPALPAARFKLGGVADTLRRSRNYQPIAHIGWTQPGYPRDAAQSMSINSLVSADSGLQGHIALSRGRYLHLTLDLVYDAPATETEAGQRYVLRRTPRMRSNERHYIDHPKFGVIAIVTPAGRDE